MHKQRERHLTADRSSYTRARVWLECVGCLHKIQAEVAPKACERCEMEGGYAPLQIATMVQSRKADDATLETQTEYIAAGSFKGLFPLGVPRGASQLWIGGPGGGKSRLSMRLGTTLGRTLVCALEMGEEMTAQMALESGAQMRNYWTCADTAALWHDLPFIDPTVVIIDSIQKMRNARRTIERLYHWAKESLGVVILICQVNSKGTARGGPAAVHDCDIELEVRKVRDGYAKFVTHKNRFSLPSGEPEFFLGYPK